MQDPADVGAADRPESVAPSLSTYGFVTPSPSPTACVSIREEADSPLEPFHEDGSVILRALADASNLTLYDSKYASKNYNGKTKYSAIPTRRAPVLSFDQSFKTLDENRAEDSASKKSEHERLVSKYQDEVLAKFIENRLPEGQWKHPTSIAVLANQTQARASLIPERNRFPLRSTLTQSHPINKHQTK